MGIIFVLSQVLINLMNGTHITYVPSVVIHIMTCSISFASTVMVLRNVSKFRSIRVVYILERTPCHDSRLEIFEEIINRMTLNPYIMPFQQFSMENWIVCDKFQTSCFILPF